MSEFRPPLSELFSYSTPKSRLLEMLEEDQRRQVEAAVDHRIRTNGNAMVRHGMILSQIPGDIKTLANTLGVPMLAERVWCDGFEAGFELAMRYAALARPTPPVDKKGEG